MRRMTSFLATLTVLALAVSAEAKSFASVELRCSILFKPSARGRATTVVLASTTTDTLLAGAGVVSPSMHGGHSGTGEPGPIYGQVIEVIRFGGADSTRLAAAFRQLGDARAVVVPWDYDPSCSPARWTRGFAWLEPEVRGTFTLRLRPDSMWVDGLPVFDAFGAVLEPYPFAFRGKGIRHSRGSFPDSPWLTAEDFFRFLLAIPPAQDWTEKPDRSWSVTRAWQLAHPDLADRYPATVITAQIAGAITRAKARRVLHSISPPITGTYSMSLALNDGPPRTFYLRTRTRPANAWRPANSPRDPAGPADEPSRPPAYNMIASAAHSMSELPTDCVNTRNLAREGYVYVIDPPAQDRERQTAWSGWLEASLLTTLFMDDPELAEFKQKEFDEWRVRRRSSTDLEAPARFWYDGDVLRVEQTLRLRDGRRLTVRGERISDAVIVCGW